MIDRYQQACVMNNHQNHKLAYEPLVVGILTSIMGAVNHLYGGMKFQQGYDFGYEPAIVLGSSGFVWKWA